MKHKTWLRVLAMLLLLGIFPAINILADPFGVFGDPIFHWYSYNETNNPRAAKVACWRTTIRNLIPMSSEIGRAHV